LFRWSWNETPEHGACQRRCGSVLTPSGANPGKMAGRAHRRWELDVNTFLGILMLDTRFPRVPGDIGLADSFRFDVRYRTVQGASPERVVRRADAALLQPFVDAALALCSEGAGAIATSCGFLSLWQRELQAALPVPVWSSSLLKLRELRHPGVVTVEARSLSEAHLMAAGADPATPVEGLRDGCPLQRTLIEDLPDLDVAEAARDTVEAAQRLVAQSPWVTDIVLECTNLPPYAAAVREATGLPVHDVVGFLHERWAALERLRKAR
jgi:hypothetical protein